MSGIVFDFDDHCEVNDAMLWMLRLREINPRFKATLFSIPGLGSETFWDDTPDWIELAMHGWTHPNPREAEHWSYEQSLDVLLSRPARFVEGWKSPGWLTSPGMYEALGELGWWMADQHLADSQRPPELPVYLYEDGENWHGHVQSVCDNGLKETWDHVCKLVEEADEFLFASERVKAMVLA